MATHLTEERPPLDQPRAAIKDRANNVNSMVGIQFYLKEDVEITHGHVAYVNSPWSLTSISQHQFWKKIDLSQYADGQVKGILSVDISEWDKPGVIEWPQKQGPPKKQTADECLPEQIKEETWQQMKTSLNVEGKEILTDDNLLAWHLEMDVVKDPNNQDKVKNLEPLLVIYV
jgi:hypothetical protein